MGWHRDDEPLFGECGDAKLIVSVSLGSSAVFRWGRQSCPDNEGHLCCLGHGDILVMDGHCQDEFRHRTDPGREKERINVTFRWVKQHVSSCLLFKDRSGMLFANVGAGFIRSCYGECCLWRFLGFFWFLIGALCIWGVLVLLVLLLCTRLGFFRFASCWTRPLGGGRWGHYRCDLWGEYLTVHKNCPLVFLDLWVFCEKGSHIC